MKRPNKSKQFPVQINFFETEIGIIHFFSLDVPRPFRFCLLVWKGPQRQLAMSQPLHTELPACWWVMVSCHQEIVLVINSLRQNIDDDLMELFCFSFVLCTKCRCEHCKNFMPTWNLLADYYGKIPHNELVTIAKVQCT